MDSASENTPARPQPAYVQNTSTNATPVSSTTFAGQDKENELSSSPTMADEEFNPSSTLNPCSPFYLYNHDSPRTSTEQFKHKASLVNIEIRDIDLEKNNSSVLARSTTTPRLSTEKQGCKEDGGVLRVWRGRRQQCMTKPKQRWLSTLPKKQKLAVKLVIAFFVVGAIVGISVGIAAGVHSGVWSGQNQQTAIGS